jgi:SAM-dependent methyltransferase
MEGTGTGSVAFDRIAERYDETRGGLERGASLAGEIAPHLRPGLVAEVGVGTGAVALPLVGHGHPVVGFDLSLPMLRRAQQRLGARVANADGYRLPARAGSVANVVMVWVLHLVPEITPMLAEAVRVLAPGGRLATIPAGGQTEENEIADIVWAMHASLTDHRPRQDAPTAVVEAAEAAGLVLTAQTVARSEPWPETPEEQARRIEARVFASLWDLPDDRWAATVEPAIAALRALPEPDRPRTRITRYEVLVFDRP